MYSHDTTRATELLIEGGWTKIDGWWYGEDDKRLSFTLPFRRFKRSSKREPREATAAQLVLDFGIETRLKSSSSWNDWFGSAQSYVWSSETFAQLDRIST
ncbi:MAG: hypothetical protein MZU97_10510 [Bacillus subtilis]|nr:hypothetical protein [Bacillus subtilis]